MFKGTLVSIHIAPGGAAPARTLAEARVVPGKGIEGDRYFIGKGTWSNHPGTGREVTLIELEAIEAIKSESGIELVPKDARRNLVTRGVPLNHLVGREFTIGGILFKGMRLCEPCEHLEGLTAKGVKGALTHRGGLRTVVVQEGTIRTGDAIEETGESKTPAAS
jgi:MOSC domain-containing protein YiiM